MLQQIREKLTGWVALAILGTIGVTFVFVGGANFAATGSNYAAKVDDADISIGQLEAAYREQVQSNPQYSDLPEDYRARLRSQVLEQLIQQRVIDNYLNDAGIRISDEQITNLIQRQPEFQVDGKFDRETYREKLAQFNYDPARYEQAQRTALRRAQLQRAIRGSSVVAPSDYRRFLNLAYEQRIVTTAMITRERVAAEVDVTDELITSFYDENPALYQIPETADVEYVEISRAAVVSDVAIDEQQVQEYYELNKDRFLQDEQRQARHILILFDDDEAAAEGVADEMLTRVRAGESFETLAQQYSKDGGSAVQGGDMGTMTRTQLTGELGEAVFSMQEGDVRGLVKSDFGFHVVRLDKIVERGPLPFDQVRPSLVSELQEQEAEGLFLALERKLSNALFDAADIRELADAAGVEVQAVAGFSRSGGEPFATNQRAIDAVFDAAVLSGAQLSEVTELDANRTVVFSVTQHNVATRKTLADVRDQIAASITNNQTDKLMAERAQQMLDAMATGVEFAAAAAAVGAQASSPTIMTRDAKDADQFVAVAIFTALKPTQDQPTTGSTRNGLGGYTVYSLDAVLAGRPESIALADRDAGREQLVDKYGVGDFVGFVQELRANADIVINEDVLAAPDLL